MTPLIAQATAQEEDIRDIVVLKPVDSIWPLIFWIATALVAVGLIVWLAFFFIKRAKKRAHDLAPETIAARSLMRLSQEREQMDPNRFSLAVSEVLKNFLVARFHDPIRYETAQEFLERFANSSIPVTHLPTAVHHNLRTFVQASEEMKFGKTPDARKKMGPLLDLATHIVSLIHTIDQAEKKDWDDSII